MSLYTDASLIMYPSGYKEDKIYSLKPTDGSGDLTFTRASTATRVNAEGLIEGVRTNLITYSEQFDNAAWVKTRLNAFGSGSIVNAIEAPDGTTSADYIQQETGQTTGGAVSVNLSISGVHSWSVFAKASEFEFLALRTRSATLTISYFDLTNGTIALADPDHSNLKITSFGNGWYRCSLSDEGGALANRFIVGGRDGANETVTPERGVYIWGAQLEASVSATEYIPTTTTAVSVGMLADVPRIDYTGGGCGKLLLESQRTNLAIYSSEFDNAAWAKENITILANDTTSPDGTTNADKISELGTNTYHALSRAINISAGTYTISIFAKSDERNYLIIRSNLSGSNVNTTFDLLNGIVTYNGHTSASIESYSNNWYRCTITSTSSLTSVNAAFLPSNTNVTNNNLPTYLGVVGSGLHIYGAQLEASSYPTSYIPTTSTAVTRLADACSKTGISSLIGQTEGVLFVDFTINSLADFGTPLSVNDGSTANYIWLTIFANGNLRAELFNSSGVQATITYTGAVVGGRYKMAFAYKTNDFAMYVNGSQVGIATSGTTFSGTTLSRIDNDITNPALYSLASQSINQTALFPTRLTNTQLATLTTI